MCRPFNLNELDVLLSLGDDGGGDEIEMILLFTRSAAGLDSGVIDDIEMTLLFELLKGLDWK